MLYVRRKELVKKRRPAVKNPLKAFHSLTFGTMTFV